MVRTTTSHDFVVDGGREFPVFTLFLCVLPLECTLALSVPNTQLLSVPNTQLLSPNNKIIQDGTQEGLMRSVGVLYNVLLGLFKYSSS